MQQLGSLLLLVVFVAASQGAAVAGATESAVAAVDGNRAAVIGFLPPAARDARDPAASEARAQVELAIERAKQCLGEAQISYQVAFVDRIVIHRLGGDDTFQVSQFAPLVGALLFRPGANPRILVAGGGPAGLVQMLPRALSEYFGTRCSDTR
ncbi:MAG TPA: hypothetical protein VMH32_22525 [Burkholderiales bacterium]|nr:hypothetical protein [Burkholderiales bacterium]